MRHMLWVFIAVFISACAQPRTALPENAMVFAEAEINAPIDAVWADWTTAEGLESFLAPKAIVELEPGGAYEAWFLPDAEPGQRGAEDGIILGLQDKTMLNFTWAMPPYMPEVRPHMTSVQIWFLASDDNRTKVKLYHTGFGAGPDWEKGEAYFEKVWPEVLAKQQAKYGG